MQEFENYILSGVFFILLCLAWWIWKRKKKSKSNAESSTFIRETLEMALSQYEIFNLKPLGINAAKTGISATLNAIDRAGLHMSVNDYVSAELVSKEVDAYFRVRQDSGPVFYVFRAQIRQLEADYEHSNLLLSFPEHLRVEKKRHFVRMKPDMDDVRVIGVWPLEPGKKLPKSTEDIGSPVTHYKPGMKEEPVQLENISASGLALRFRLDADGKTPIEWKIGSQILCLVVYNQGEASERPVAFWCTGEVMNSRTDEGPKPSLVLGLEFTNWAVLEQGKGEIHWAHSSPSRGAKPMLQWVEKMEHKKLARQQGSD